MQRTNEEDREAIQKNISELREQKHSIQTAASRLETDLQTTKREQDLYERQHEDLLQWLNTAEDRLKTAARDVQPGSLDKRSSEFEVETASFRTNKRYSASQSDIWHSA